MPTVLKAGEILFLPYNEAGILSDDFLITSSHALKKVRAIAWNEFRMDSPANSLTESSFFAIHSFKFGMVYTSLRQVHLHTHLHINDPNVDLFVCLSFLLYSFMFTGREGIQGSQEICVTVLLCTELYECEDCLVLSRRSAGCRDL